MQDNAKQKVLEKALSIVIKTPVSPRWYGQVEVYRDMGGDVNDRDWLGWTMLHTAAMGADVEAVRHLVELGADVSARDCHGQTPLHYAVDEAYRQVFEWDRDLDLRIVRELLVLGADPLARDRSGCTPRDLVRAYGPSALADYDAVLHEAWAMAA